MSSYVLMLQADPDDQHITESALAEINPSIGINYLPRLDEIDKHVAKAGPPVLILLNDMGTITERGQALRKLKSDPAYSHIPVVVLGEKSSPDYVKECYRAGASTFITKPSSVNATRRKIEMFFSYWFEVAEV
jgi:DNA-binding NarL/FixJ family response regulator